MSVLKYLDHSPQCLGFNYVWLSINKIITSPKDPIQLISIGKLSSYASEQKYVAYVTFSVIMPILSGACLGPKHMALSSQHHR